MNTRESMIECVPNFSEGTNVAAVREIVHAMQVEGVSLLDYSLDPDHNRSVVTLAGAPGPTMEAVLRGVGKATELIDMTGQQGVHPRIGATDVVPLVPIRNISLPECAALAHQLGQEIWKRHHVPVYFYEAAALRPDRRLLENIRNGQFEGLRKKVQQDAASRPDVGGPSLHPTAGAVAVGARQFLIACNVFLNTGNVGIARSIARDIRASSGGLAGLKAMGVLVSGKAQVSMNITDFRATPVSKVYQAVRDGAAQLGVQPDRVELIGLVPEAAVEPGSEWLELATNFSVARTLESRLETPMIWP
ncbi:MAG TPA: glutamate formimidoyltransferase [Acidobacteriaceae bacterium]|nr:glutamate formimidoyltransferase [Acidobacteriaceae bacterium]